MDETSATMTILANGQTRTIQAGWTIGDLLQDLKITPARVVVQLDGEIVPRETFAQTSLREGSRLEIIALVGGG